MSKQEGEMLGQLKKDQKAPRADLHKERDKTIRERFLTDCVIRHPHAETISELDSIKLSRELLYETYRAAKCRTPEEEHQSYEILRKLIAHGAKVNRLSNGAHNGFAPLHIATLFRKPELIEFLLLNGAQHDLAIQDKPNPAYSVHISDLTVDLEAPWCNRPGYGYTPDHMMHVSFTHEQTPANLYTVQSYPHVPETYSAIVERSHKVRQASQSRQSIASLLALNSKAHSNNPSFASSIDALLPQILTLAGIPQAISKQDLKKAQEESLRLRVVEPSVRALTQSMSSGPLASTPKVKPPEPGDSAGHEQSKCVIS